MTDEDTKPKTWVRRQRSIYQVHYGLQRRTAEDMAKPLLMPPGELQAFGQQVAGHRASVNNKFTGLLQCNGTVLKPILKESQKREVEFYQRISQSTNRDLVELRALVPKYYGCKKFTYKGFEQDYIILEDLTQRMLEQCVMDAKIGKRTWDPLASEEKIRREESKYALCKQQYGFCIPGYQVFKLSTGRLLKYGKDYGKKLHGRMVKEAIRNYLNGVGAPFCRSLLLQLLTALWRVQQWARRQTAVRLYCTSLLLVYDAARLRACCGDPDALTSRSSCRPGAALSRRRSLHAAAPRGPRSPAPRPLPRAQSPAPARSPWGDALDKLTSNHAFDHNYEDKLSRIKMNYRAVLEQLSNDEPSPDAWAAVKVIDFAHAFFNDDNEPAPDDNFREGIDSIVEIFEGFLRETEGQV